MGTSAVDDFDWLVQLRYYIEAMAGWGNWGEPLPEIKAF
jgi:hypothetical protein